MTIIDILIQFRPALLSGLLVTMQIVLITRSWWIIIWTILWILASNFKKTIGWFINVLSLILGWVPMLVLLYWLYFPFQQYFQVDISSFTLASLAFVTVNALFVSKIVRSAIENLPAKYIVTSKLMWLTKRQTISKIKLPLISRHVIWPIIMLQIVMLHNSIFASLINVDEIFRQIQRINAIIYKPIELYTMLAIFFIILSVPLYLLARYYKNKYSNLY